MSIKQRACRGETYQFIKDHIDYEGDDCLIWPFGKDPKGYGKLRYRGNATFASRVMCIEAHGEPPGPKLDAAHSCGNGHLGCVNPNHISWKTRAENYSDAVLHGTASLKYAPIIT